MGPAEGPTGKTADALTDRQEVTLPHDGAHDAGVHDALAHDSGGHDAVHSVDATGDSGSASLDWYPGNYGLTDTGNDTARDAFLTGTLSSAFDGVEMIYAWTTCETKKDDYSACFAAIDADLAATPAGKHIILMLQYKQFGSGSGLDAVPAYLRSGPGKWCVSSGSKEVCGQYETPGSAVAMLWNDAVAARLHAWFAALGAYYGPGGPGHARADKIAGIVLPETSTGAGGTTSLASVGYTSADYVSAIEANLSALSTAFPTKPVFQYINFLPTPGGSEVDALKSIGDWALKQRHIGLGCPDVGGNSSFHPPGYDTLMDTKYQVNLPFNVAIEPMDFGSKYTSGLKETYAEATELAADGGMAAQFVVWWHEEGKENVFTIDDVAKFLPTHPNPNVAPPKY
jgi:hypothetical protein